MEIQCIKPVLDTLTLQDEKLGREIKKKIELQAAMGLVRSYFEDLRHSRGHSRPSVRVEDPETNLSGLFVDFSGSRNTLERVIRIGEAAEGKLLNATKVARFLIDAGESRGKLDSVRRNVGDALKLSPQYFEAVSPRIFRFLGRNATIPIQPLGERIPKEDG